MIASSTRSHTANTIERFFCQNSCNLSSNDVAVVASTATRLRSSPAGLGVEGVAGMLRRTGFDYGNRRREQMHVPLSISLFSLAEVRTRHAVALRNTLDRRAAPTLNSPAR